MGCDRWLSFQWHSVLEERLLAVLVATASEQGPRGIVAACRAIKPEDAAGALPQLLGMLGDGTRPGAFDNVIHDRAGYVGIIRS